MSKNFALLIGLQGSGKTNFATKFLIPKGYKFINGDIFLSKNQKSIPHKKILKTSKEIIKSDYIGIVFEFSNSNSEQRTKLLNIGKSLGMEIEYFILNTSLNTALERNKKREGNSKIPEEIIKKRSSALLQSPPCLSEGVDVIYKVDIKQAGYLVTKIIQPK